MKTIAFHNNPDLKTELLAMEFPLQTVESISVGVDLNQIMALFMIFLMQSALDKFEHDKYSKCKESVDRLISLLSVRDMKKARRYLIEIYKIVDSCIKEIDNDENIEIHNFIEGIEILVNDIKNILEERNLHD
jgi:hypothetical protein